MLNLSEEQSKKIEQIAKDFAAIGFPDALGAISRVLIAPIIPILPNLLDLAKWYDNLPGNKGKRLYQRRYSRRSK